MLDPIQQTVDPNDYTLIHKITARANEEGLVASDIMTLSLDMKYAHMACPLNLEALLEADTQNFAHDIVGIQNNINRKTYKLDNLFIPRYARKSGDA